MNTGPAELILANAKVLPSAFSRSAPREVAIRGGTILCTGVGLAAMRDLSKGANVLDCRGGTVLPGFVDAHLHLAALADDLVSVNLRPDIGIRSIGQIQAALRMSADATPEGGWLTGKGYDQFYLEEKRHPNRWDLDSVTPFHPVKHTHRSHHAHVLNSLGLNNLGIGRSTPDPPGGVIDRDPATGEPTGLLFEMGQEIGASGFCVGESSR